MKPYEKSVKDELIRKYEELAEKKSAGTITPDELRRLEKLKKALNK